MINIYFLPIFLHICCCSGQPTNRPTEDYSIGTRTPIHVNAILTHNVVSLGTDLKRGALS